MDEWKNSCKKVCLVNRFICIYFDSHRRNKHHQSALLRSFVFNDCLCLNQFHGRETREARTERSLASARLAVLEAVGFSIGLLRGTKTRGRRPDRMAESYPELQEFVGREKLSKFKQFNTL